MVRLKIPKRNWRLPTIKWLPLTSILVVGGLIGVLGTIYQHSNKPLNASQIELKQREKLLRPNPKSSQKELSKAEVKGSVQSYQIDQPVSRNLILPSSGKMPELIVNQSGKEVNLANAPFSLESELGSGVAKVVLTPKGTIPPGKYSIVARDPENQKVVDQQDFSWGVLTFNPNYSIYRPKSTAELAIGVLDDTGRMVCDAVVMIAIRTPSGKVDYLGTGNGSVQVNQHECSTYGVTEKPDYQASYKPTEVGDYAVRIVASTEWGERVLLDHFSVESDQEVYVERIGATRIYPIDTYTNKIRVSASTAGTYSVTERVNTDFEVTANDAVIEESGDGGKLIRWKAIQFDQGSVKEFTYTYNAPDVSPYLYTVGKLEITREDQSIYSEPRLWLIASDTPGSGSASRLWTSGFELQSTTAAMEYTANIGTTPTISTSTKRSGSAALRTSASAGTSGMEYDFATANTSDGLYFRAYFNAANWGSDTFNMLELYDSGNTIQLKVRHLGNSVISACNHEDDSTCETLFEILGSSDILSTSTWYRLEIKADTTTLGTTKIEMRINGALVSIGTVNWANGPMTLRLGVLSTATADIYWDDVAINNDSGTDISMGNYPNAGSVVHLKPNEDGTNVTWSNGAGTVCSNAAADCWDKVNEVTPTDGASSDFITTPGTCSTSSMQDFTLEDSSTGGMTSTSIIKLVQPNVRIAKASNLSNSSLIVSVLSGADVDSGSAMTMTNGTYLTNDDTGATGNPTLTLFDLPGTGTSHLSTWTPTTIDSMQLRIAPNGTDCSPLQRLDAIWATVEYNSNEGGRMFSSGFELQSITAGVEWTAVTNTPAIDTTTKRTGSASLRATGWTSSTAELVSHTFASANADGPYYARTYYRATTLPAASTENRIISFRDSGGTDRAYITITDTGTLKLYDEDGQVGSASSALSTGTWYRIEMQFNRNAGSNGTVAAMIDGAAAFATSSTRSISTGVDKYVVGGNLGAAAITAGDWYFDDIAINQNVGTEQNGYPGEGGIVHMKPNANGDTVTWTNTYTNIDEVTPNDATDVVSTSTVGQAEDANLESSATAGITAGSVMNAVSAGVRFNSSSTATSGFKVRIIGSALGQVVESSEILNNSTTWKTNVSSGPMAYPVTLYNFTQQTIDWTTTFLDSAQVGVRATTDTADTQQVSTVWLMVDFYVPSIQVSGNAYDDQGSTVWAPCDGSTANISLVVNGGTAQTTNCNDTTGEYQFTASGIAVGDEVSVFFNTTGGNTDKGVAVTVLNDVTSAITLNPRKNIIGIDSESGTISQTNMNHCDSVAPAQCANVPYELDLSNRIVTSSTSVKVVLESGASYQGGIEGGKFEIRGTYNGGILTLYGSGTGTSRPLYINGGSAPSAINAVYYGTSNSEVELGTSYISLDIYPVSGTPTYTLGTANSQTLTSTSTFRVGDGTVAVTADASVYNPAMTLLTVELCATTCTQPGNFINGTGTITLSPSGTTFYYDNNSSAQNFGNLSISGGASTPSLTLTAVNSGEVKFNSISVAASHTLAADASLDIFLAGTTGTLFSIDGTFTQGTTTLRFTGDGSPTLFAANSESSTVYNLSIEPTITANRTYALNSGGVGVSVNFYTIDATAASTATLTVQSNNTLSASAASISTISGTNQGYTVFDSVNSSSISLGGLQINSQGKFKPNGSTVTVSRSTGTGLSLASGGELEGGTSTITFNGNGSFTPFSGAFTGTNAFNNVTFSPALSGGAKTYTLSGSAVEVNGNFNITPSAGAASQSLLVNMGGNLTMPAGKTLTINANDVNNPTVTLDTRPVSTSYNITAGGIVVGDATGGADTLDAGGSTSVITLLSTSGTLFNVVGTFTEGTSEVVVASASGTPRLSSTAGTTYHKLTINSAATVVNAGADFSTNSTAGNTVRVQSGVFNISTYTITAGTAATLQLDSGGTLCIGSGNTISAADCSGADSTSASAMPAFTTYTFDAASTVIYRGNVNTTIDSTPTYGNLKLTPTFSSAGRTYTTEAGTLNINGDFTINSSSPGTSYDLSVTGNSTNIVMLSTKTLSIFGSGTSDVTLTRGNVTLTAGYIDIGTQGTLSVGGTSTATITLTGTSGTLFTKTGTFSQGYSEVIVTSASGSPTLLSAATTFHKLTINSAATKINAGQAITLSAASCTEEIDIVQGVLDDNGYQITDGGCGTFTMAANTTLILGNATATQFPTVFVISAIFLDDASTVIYNSTSNQTISADPTYGNVQLSASSGTPTKTCIDLFVDGDLTIDANNTLSITGTGNVILKGDYVNNGTFTANSSDFRLTGTTKQTLSGTMTGGSAFYDLTITNASGTAPSDNEITGFVPSVDFDAAATVTNNFEAITASTKLQFNNGSTYTFNNININGQAGGTLIYLRNSAASGTWLMNVTGTQTAVSYVDVSRSDASGGDPINSDATDVDSGNNVNWFGMQISGIVYLADGSTEATSGNGGDCDSSTAVISVRVDGGTAETTDCSSTDGSFTISLLTPPTTGQTVAIYLTGSLKANTVYTTDATADTGIDLIEGRLILRHENAGPLTIVDLTDYDNDQNATDMLFDAEDSSPDTLTMDSGTELHIQSGDTFTPGGTVSAVSLRVAGTMSMGANALNISSDYTNSGTFTAGTSVTTFTATSSGKNLSGTMTGSSKFYDLVFNGVGGEWTTNAAVEVGNDYTVTNGSVIASNNNATVTRDYSLANTSGVSYTAGSSTITVSRHYNDPGGKLSAGTSTVTLNGTGTMDIAGSYTFYNLNLAYSGFTTTLDSSVSTRVSNDATLNGGTMTGSSSAFEFVATATNQPLTFNAPTTINGSGFNYFGFGINTASITVTIGGGDYGSWTVFAFYSANNGTFNLGGDLATGGQLRVFTGSPTGGVFNSQNYAISADSLQLGSGGATVAHTVNLGSSTVNLWSSSDGLYPEGSGGTYALNLGSATINVYGNVKFADSSGAITVTPGTSHIRWLHTSGAKTFAPNSQSVHNVTLTAPGGTVQPNGAVDINGDFTINSGTFDTVNGSNYAVTIGGNLTKIGTLTPRNSTFTFDATDIGNTLGGGSFSFYKIVFNGVGGAWTIKNYLSVTGAASDAFDIGNGTVTMGDSYGDDLQVVGGLTIATTANEVGTLKTPPLPSGSNLYIDINENKSYSPIDCATCAVTVGASSGSGQGNLKLAKNTVMRLNAPQDAETNIGVTVQSTGYLEVLGSQDYTGSSTGVTETTLTDTSKNWVADEHYEKVLRMTSGLAAGSVYYITDNDATSLTRTTTESSTATMTVTGSGDVRTVCASTNTVVTTNREHAGRYLRDQTGTTGLFQILTTANNDTGCSGSNDSYVIAAAPGSFTALSNGDTFSVVDGVRAGDSYEIIDFASITAEQGEICGATVNDSGMGEAFIHGAAGSQTLMRYAMVCNLGRTGTAGVEGMSFDTVDGSAAANGLQLDTVYMQFNNESLYMEDSPSNTIKDVTIIYSSESGITLLTSDNNTLSDISMSAIGVDGIRATGDNNQISSIKVQLAGGEGIEATGSMNVIADADITGIGGQGIDFGSGSSSSVVDAVVAGSASNGIRANTGSGGHFIGNVALLANGANGFYTNASTGNTVYNANFAGNTTSDINLNSSAISLNLYATALGSSTPLSGVSSATITSRAHNDAVGDTRIWGAYSVPADVTETPQVESVEKFNYANHLWEKSTLAHVYTGTGTEDTNLSPSVATSNLSGGAYVYRAVAQAGGNANCVTPTVFTIYRNGVNAGTATCGVQYTDAGGTGVQFTIAGGATGYAAGDTYIFSVFDASGSANTAKTVTMMQDGDTITVASGRSIELKGASGSETTITRGGAGSTGWHMTVAGTINAEHYIMSYMGGASGATGLDIQSGATITGLSYGTFNNFQSVGASDTFIKIHNTLVGSGSPSRVVQGLTFTQSGSEPEYSITSSGGVYSDGNFWNLFPVTCTGWANCEASDSDPGDGASAPNQNGLLRFSNDAVVSGRVDSGTIRVDGGTVRVE